MEDSILIWKFKRGCDQSLERIYDKYSGQMRALATGLLGDISRAEDIVHDVFVRFAANRHSIKIKGSLKAYLSVSVVNGVRDIIRRGKHITCCGIDEAQHLTGERACPAAIAENSELADKLTGAFAILPIEQREVLLLRIKGGIKFREIAKLQNISTNTAQTRYRYALDKLRSIFNGEL